MNSFNINYNMFKKVQTAVALLISMNVAQCEVEDTKTKCRALALRGGGTAGNY